MILKFQEIHGFHKTVLGDWFLVLALIIIWVVKLGADVRKEDQENIKCPP